MSDVTFFLTSCKRHDLLKICLESFEKFNTYPIDRAIIIEDSPLDISWVKDVLKSIPNVELINTGGRQGQLRNIDRCYAMINTPYVFHCEDDFEFTQSGFIEGSKTILEAEEKCVNVWLHPYDACPAEHTLKEKLSVNGVEYYGVVSLTEGEGGLGFTFQPSLHRIADWKKWGNYESVIDRIAPWCNKFDGAQVERNLARNFIQEGYHTRILSHPGKIGYFLSTGHTRHVPLPTKQEIVHKRIFDCFTFYNEFDILELRLEELWDTVDYFVISEANTTHQNNTKNFNLKDNWDRFEKYASKIRYVTVEDMPCHTDTWVNERFQRKAIERGLTDLKPDDIICVSDCDEIPRPEALEAIRNDENDYDRYILAIPLNYFRLNYMMVTPLVKQNNIMVTRGRAFTDPQNERALTFNTGNLPMHFANDQFCVIEHGGWHWTYYGQTEFAKNKIRNFAHAETNVPWIMDNLNVEEIVKHKYGIGWDKGNERFEYVVVDDYFPKTVLKNIEKYKHMIIEGATHSVYDFYPE